MVHISYISKQELYSLKSSDYLLPKAYKLSIIHKEKILFRIIVSSINSTLYSLTNYLHQILHKSLPLFNNHVKNSFELYNILQGKKIPENHLLMSLDVIFLFTNVPLKLVVEGINSRWQYIQKFHK